MVRARARARVRVRACCLRVRIGVRSCRPRLLRLLRLLLLLRARRHGVLQRAQRAVHLVLGQRGWGRDRLRLRGGV